MGSIELDKLCKYCANTGAIILVFAVFVTPLPNREKIEEDLNFLYYEFVVVILFCSVGMIYFFVGGIIGRYFAFFIFFVKAIPTFLK